MNWLKIDDTLKQFLEEDILWEDITSSFVDDNKISKATIKLKQSGVVCGLLFAKRVFELLGIKNIFLKANEGEYLEQNTIIMELSGYSKHLLMGERVALNILQSLSGIATEAFEMSNLIKDYGVGLLDTRKTTPGYRFFEKYAVRVGGGLNHRFSLYDMVLIKDNHINVYGSISKAVETIRRHISMAYKIEVEVKSIQELQEAISLPIDIVLLDNFSVDNVEKAINIIRTQAPYIKIEISGQIRKSNILEYAKHRPDFISSGAIIHSSKWVDISMDIY